MTRAIQVKRLYEEHQNRKHKSVDKIENQIKRILKYLFIVQNFKPYFYNSIIPSCTDSTRASRMQ